jgi:PAS domain S-box-containing protein
MDDEPEPGARPQDDLRRRAEQELRARGEDDLSGLSEDELRERLRESRLREVERELSLVGAEDLEAELAHQQQLFRRLIDTVPVMIAVYDEPLKHFQFNRRLKDTLGWTAEDAKDPAFLERMYPDPGWRDIVVTAKDGTPIETSWANVRLTDRFRIGIGLDIRERKRREAELALLNARLAEHAARRSGELQNNIIQLEQESERRKRAEQSLRDRGRVLEAFFEHTQSPLVFLATDLRVVRANQAFASAMRVDREQLFGRDYFEACPGNLERAIFEEALETGRPQRGSAAAFAWPCREDGGPTFWNWRLVPLLEEDEAVSQLVLTLDDVTEETRTREELEAANAELSRLADQLRSLAMQLAEAEDQERRRLAEILHDDLQQLLTGARYQLGALAKQAEDREGLGPGLSRIEELVQDAAEKARSLSHELRPAVLEQVELGPALEWLASDMQEKHGLKVRVLVQRQQELQLAAGLRLFLYKAARELLFNVIKHSGGREARIVLRVTAEHVELRVRDDGMGFDPDALGAPGQEGAGFGLFGIRERLRLLGGSTTVESTPGRGTSVKLSVPLQTASAARRGGQAGEPAGPEEPARPEEEAGPIRVLLADDHAQAREGLIALLGEQPDIEIVGQASDGQRAAEMARQLVPDVILMDLSMPLLDGISATEVVKQERPEVRVIGLSLYGETELAKRMTGAGAEVCLSKTDPPEDLLAAVRGSGHGDPSRRSS